MRNIADVKAAVQARGLNSVWTAADKVGGQAIERLAEDISSIDWDVYERQKKALRDGKETELGAIEAPQLIPPSAHPHEGREDALAAGEKALRQGQVAIITVAGGQASRLGFDGPKGAFPLGVISGASLFQMFAGQIQRLRQVYDCALPWIIQTGPGNHLETMAFFEKHSHFGLGSDSIDFVCQGTLPALAPNGELLLSAPHRLFRNPDGHGGVYRALKGSGTIPRLRTAGITTLFYCQVDNPLVWMADPIFIGHHLLAQARMSVKVVEKTDPAEKVGLVVIDGARNRCVEYSDISDDLQAERAEDGGLRFCAGNIAIHLFDLDFAEEMAEASLQLHLARKQVLALPAGGLVAEERDGIKFETFVFDALPLAEKSVVQLADRALEFAPVKNRSGVDSIQTSKEALALRSERWLKESGLALDSAVVEGPIEFEPGLCLGPEDLRSRAEIVTNTCAGRLVKVTR
ncbi:MAG: UTP--glucose-1-phosphate uridylyltransferase [Planctomycetota bacterium]|nr:UTP--glucose-1-phosphate uridylyltransferase [Planctomycetota bacterium]